MGLARELLAAHVALEQHLRRHVHHLDVHLENVLVLPKTNRHSATDYQTCVSDP